MSGGFCGIDPPALSELAQNLDWIATDVDALTGRARERLTRHARWGAADEISISMAATSHWARSNADEIRLRVQVMQAAQGVEIFGPPLTSGSWRQYPNPLPWPGPFRPGFPMGQPLGHLNDVDVPWDDIEDWVRGALGIWNGRVDDTFPVGRWVAGTLYTNRVVRAMRGRGPVPHVLNGFVPRTLANTRYFTWINNPAVQVVGRRVSIGLSAYSTVSDAVVVWNHGNPIDAFEREGAGYVADVARLGFSGSTTAFLIAPNPITGGVVIVTGVVWAGAEVVDHWDEITEFWEDVYADVEDGSQWLYDRAAETVGAGWDWTSDQADDVTQVTTDVVDGLVDGYVDIQQANIDQLSRAIGWGNAALGGLTDWVGERIDNVTSIGAAGLDQLDQAVEWGRDRLDDAADWTGDRIEDLTDVGESLADTGGNLLGAGKSWLGF